MGRRFETVRDLSGEPIQTVAFANSGGNSASQKTQDTGFCSELASQSRITHPWLGGMVLGLVWTELARCFYRANFPRSIRETKNDQIIQRLDPDRRSRTGASYARRLCVPDNES